jgi:hypothetical protein
MPLDLNDPAVLHDDRDRTELQLRERTADTRENLVPTGALNRRAIVAG